MAGLQLHQPDSVNAAMTPDLVSAAFHVADSSTNVITPMMIYSGVILAFMRKYRPDLGGCGVKA